jgi:hypothetical protein
MNDVKPQVTTVNDYFENPCFFIDEQNAAVQILMVVLLQRQMLKFATAGRKRYYIERNKKAEVDFFSVLNI